MNTENIVTRLGRELGVEIIVPDIYNKYRSITGEIFNNIFLLKYNKIKYIVAIRDGEAKCEGKPVSFYRSNEFRMDFDYWMSARLADVIIEANYSEENIGVIIEQIKLIDEMFRQYKQTLRQRVVRDYFENNWHRLDKFADEIMYPRLVGEDFAECYVRDYEIKDNEYGIHELVIAVIMGKELEKMDVENYSKEKDEILNVKAELQNKLNIKFQNIRYRENFYCGESDLETLRFLRIKYNQQEFDLCFEDNATLQSEDADLILMNCGYDIENDKFTIIVPLNEYKTAYISKTIKKIDRAVKFFSDSSERNKVEAFVVEHEYDEKLDSFREQTDLIKELSRLYIEENKIQDSILKTKFIALCKIISDIQKIREKREKPESKKEAVLSNSREALIYSDQEIREACSCVSSYLSKMKSATNVRLTNNKKAKCKYLNFKVDGVPFAIRIQNCRHIQSSQTIRNPIYRGVSAWVIDTYVGRYKPHALPKIINSLLTTIQMYNCKKGFAILRAFVKKNVPDNKYDNAKVDTSILADKFMTENYITKDGLGIYHLVIENVISKIIKRTKIS